VGRTKDGGALVHIAPTAAGVVFDGESLDSWDDEELMRGRRRNKRGGFSGRPPRVVPAALLQELNRRRFSRAYELMAHSLVDAALMLRSIIVDEAVDASDRIRAAEVLMDRILGKPKESVALDVRAGGGERPLYLQAVEQALVVGTDRQARATVRAARRAANQS
jgi:hypothetical protein